MSDEKLGRDKDGRGWWQGHMLRADVRKMSPMEGKEVRRETDWYRAVIGRNELLALPLLSTVLLAGLFSDDSSAFVAGLLSALTIAATLVPAATIALVSRLSYDKVIEKAEAHV
ncbi:hypothetical protein SUDANB2_04146 [Streptomyces sp. enrichment culture]